MKRVRHYLPEIALLAAVILISVAGFWNIFLKPAADPQPHHFLHFATAFLWMGLRAAQLHGSETPATSEQVHERVPVLIRGMAADARRRVGLVGHFQRLVDLAGAEFAHRRGGCGPH